MNEIIPAILPKNVSDLRQKLEEIPDELELVHIDVLENDIWTDTKKNFEVHLMVSKPEAIVERWINRGTKNIIVHKLTEKISEHKNRVKIGLAVELQTDLEDIFSYIKKVDFIHLMSIAEIGAQGHPLDDKIFDRIKKVREKFPLLPISVDGGVNITNLEKLKSAGATRFVVGSGFKDLWKSLTKN